MCKYCHRDNCPENCPSFGANPPRRSGSPRRYCKICMGLIPSGDISYSSGEKYICYSCCEQMDIYDLMRVCGAEDRRELISSLGFHAD